MNGKIVDLEESQCIFNRECISKKNVADERVYTEEGTIGPISEQPKRVRYCEEYRRHLTTVD